VLIVLFQHLIDLFYAIWPRPFPVKECLEKVKIVAHRGAHSKAVTENTLEAFQKALDLKLYGIEFDIRWTKDLVPVVHHDKCLNRIFKIDVLISEINFKELRQIAPDVPSLSEAIQLCAKKIHLFIELKDEYFPNLIKQNDILTQVLSELKPGDDFHLMSLDNNVLSKFNQFDKKTYLLIAVLNMLEQFELSKQNEISGVTGHFFLFKNKYLKECQNIGLLSGTGFPKSMNAFKAEVNREIDFIFTDHPDRLIRYLKILKSE